MFQQRHFEAMASMMQQNFPKHGDKILTHEAYWQQIVGALVDVFKQSNPHFDESRFRAACVPGANVRARNNQSGPAMPYVTPRVTR
jgi:hypothetical protein